MALILGLLAIAVFAIYLDRRYHRICEEDKAKVIETQAGYRFADDLLRSREDWDFPPKWHPPIGRTKA